MFRNARNARMMNQALNAEQLASLRQANQLITNGHPGEAAPLLAQLAGQMQASKHPRRAANLYARTAHAYADAKDGPAAVAHARTALDLFLQFQMIYRAPQFYTNITRKLANNGMKPAAAHLEQEYAARIERLPAAPAAGQAHRGQLPTNCPKCGAPVHGDDVNWVDATTAECDYCGSLIRASD